MRTCWGGEDLHGLFLRHLHSCLACKVYHYSFCAPPFCFWAPVLYNEMQRLGGLRLQRLGFPARAWNRSTTYCCVAGLLVVYPSVSHSLGSVVAFLFAV
jgi:hypothetical protein